MAHIGILIDSRPEYLGGNASLLTAAGGGRALSDEMAQLLVAVGCTRLAVLPEFHAGDAYRDALATAAPAISLMSLSHFEEMLIEAEPADMIALLDARFFPDPSDCIADLNQAIGNLSLVTHLIPIESNPDGVREHILLDPYGRVRAVQRLYDGRTRTLGLGVSCTVAPVSALRMVRPQADWSLSELRVRLSERRVPARDIPIQGKCFDLRSEAGFLARSEHELRHLFSGQVAAENGTPERKSVREAATARVDATARLFGPVVVEAGAVIERDAVVIGPALVGRGAVIGADAVVSGAVVLPGAAVGAGDRVFDRVIACGTSAGRSKSATNGAAEMPRPSPARRGRESLPVQRPQRYVRVKGIVDVCFALATLILMAPLLVVTAILVKLTSRGPILFGHVREGLQGRPFKCWKFRTMVDGAHLKQRELYAQNAVDGPQFKMAADPRVTPIGKFLRSSNIDELPQFFNVLLGQMSVIGPRPSPFRENQICVPWRDARLSVRPGITGLWQICRHDRDAGDFHQWIYFDTLYVRNLSWRLDLRIFLATMLTLGGRWSVPISWIIPHVKGKAREADRGSAAVVSRNRAGEAESRNASVREDREAEGIAAELGQDALWWVAADQGRLAVGSAGGRNPVLNRDKGADR